MEDSESSRKSSTGSMIPRPNTFFHILLEITLVKRGLLVEMIHWPYALTGFSISLFRESGAKIGSEFTTVLGFASSY